MTSGNNIVQGKDAPEKQFPSLNATYAGWKVSEKDLVNYKDVQRRNLEFLFSIYREAPNGVIDSPMNKFVSVYQKNEEGDFIIVSISGNNPNDIRLMEMTNEYYGDPDPDPMTLVMKSIEMADDSGMIRSKDDYGNYGIVETASGPIYKDFVEGVGKEPTPERTDSAITGHSPLAQKIANAMTGAVAGLGGAVLNTTAGGKTSTVTGGSVIKNMVKGLFGKKKSATDPVAMENLKHEHRKEITTMGIAGKAAATEHIQELKGAQIQKVAETKAGIYDKDTLTKYHQTNFSMGLSPESNFQASMDRTEKAYNYKPRDFAKPVDTKKPIAVAPQAAPVTPVAKQLSVTYGATTATGIGAGIKQPNIKYGNTSVTYSGQSKAGQLKTPKNKFSTSPSTPRGSKTVGYKTK